MIKLFKDGVPVLTGGYSLQMSQVRCNNIGMLPGEGTLATTENLLTVADCHTDLSEGVITVDVLGKPFLAAPSSAFLMTRTPVELYEVTLHLYPTEHNTCKQTF